MRTVRLGWWLATAVTAAAITTTVAMAARSPVPDRPAPPAIPAVQPDTLTARYAANRGYIEASARFAAQLKDGRRQASLLRLAAPGRQILTFSPDGDGRVVEVVGDLARADRIAIVVPGSDTTIDTFDSLGGVGGSLAGGSRALAAALADEAPAVHVAVVAWYGYPAPRTLSPAVLTTGRAEVGGDLLNAFLHELQTVNPHAPVTLLCHSYGSVTCLRTLTSGPPADRSNLAAVAVFGSPGMGSTPLPALHLTVPVWAGRDADDWIADVPHTSVRILGHQIGFGLDPTAPAFGARSFPVSSGHSGYLRRGGAALRSLARISLDLDPDLPVKSRG